jgi:hypothetical protein
MMDENQRGREQLDAFMASNVAAMVVRPGSEDIFARQVEGFVRGLNAEPWVMEPEFLGPEVSRFLEDEIHAGRLQGIGADEATSAVARDQYEEVFAAVYTIASTVLEEHGLAWGPGLVEEADLRVEAAVREGPQESRSITERVQAVMQEIYAFVRGRDGHEQEQDQERGR